MNTDEFYVRHDDRQLPPEPSLAPTPDPAVSALAVHRDPSVPPPSEAEPTPQRGIAWVRPTELPTLLGSKVAGRGIDLQSELVRRSRRTPISAARASRRITRSSISRSEPATPTASRGEELGL